MPIDLSAKGLKITPRLKSWLDDNGYRPRTLAHSSYVLKAAEAMSEGDLSADEYLTLTDQEVTDMPRHPDIEDGFSNPTKNTYRLRAKDVFSDPTKGTGSIRLKAPSESLSTKRYPVKTKRGETLHDELGREIMSSSERSKAEAGIYLKASALRGGIHEAEMSEWEKSLLSEMVETQQWACYHGDEHENKIVSGAQTKALLDESGTSNGLELVPVTFDADVVWASLLGGEVAPLADLKPVSKGRRVESASVGTPTVSWGTGEGTEGTLFDFADYVSAVDSTIYPVVAFLEVGRDFLSDSPVDVGEILTQRIAERMSSELDKVCVTGNGTTQPEGIENKSGITSVAWGGTTSLGNYESLLFAVGKQYRKSSDNRFVFIGNETAYMRARALPVGASDARRLFGMTHEDYKIFSRDYRICEDLDNTDVIAACMNKFRLYRRMGLSTQWSTEGKSLLRANTALLAVRGRWGGQCMIGEAFAMTTTAPA